MNHCNVGKTLISHPPNHFYHSQMGGLFLFLVPGIWEARNCCHVSHHTIKHNIGTATPMWCYATARSPALAHMWCYATVGSLTLPHIRHAMYATVRSLAFPHICDATLLYILLHWHTYVLLLYVLWHFHTIPHIYDRHDGDDDDDDDDGDDVVVDVETKVSFLARFSSPL